MLQVQTKVKPVKKNNGVYSVVKGYEYEVVYTSPSLNDCVQWALLYMPGRNGIPWGIVDPNGNWVDPPNN